MLATHKRNDMNSVEKSEPLFNNPQCSGVNVAIKGDTKILIFNRPKIDIRNVKKIPTLLAQFLHFHTPAVMQIRKTIENIIIPNAICTIDVFPSV